jgi:hypothetical protein
MMMMTPIEVHAYVPPNTVNAPMGITTKNHSILFIKMGKNSKKNHTKQ